MRRVSAVGGRLDQYSVRVIDDDFDFILSVPPFDGVLMYAPGTKRQQEKSDDRRDRRFHNPEPQARLCTREKPRSAQ